MPISSRTFRVFVSSTFEDLRAERDALQRSVFPSLRALCARQGARFQAIDLRWGVRDEAALDQQTIEICLREIRRCQATGVRPNFLVLLGDRYGWRPPPARIPAAEFEDIQHQLPPGPAAALVEEWYRLDENAVPPEYRLQARTGRFVSADAWSAAERVLQAAMATAAELAGLPAAARIKYDASATHQEILAGLGHTQADREHVFAFVRRPAGVAEGRLARLTRFLRETLGGNVAEFEAGDTASLCDAVFARLAEVIGQEERRFSGRPALDLEVEAHDRFAAERSRIFVGRREVLDAVAGYIGGPERRPLILRGAPGSGKSAVIAMASEQCQGLGRVIRRFVGASPDSTSGHALLAGLCRQMGAGDAPVDFPKLEAMFKERLSHASAGQPLALFVDAIDQLAPGDPARTLNWLPQELPPQVRVVVSAGMDLEPLIECGVVRLERMSASEGGQALDAYLRDARRTLQPRQRRKVLAHFERCGLALYLKLAAEECRLWKSYTPPGSCPLGEGIAGITDVLIARLADDANHGPTLVERSLSYLAAARHGLTEDEILDVLAADAVVWDDFDRRKHHDVSERRLPPIVWSRLSLDLAPYLSERAAPGGTVTTFFHRQLAERIVARFLGGGASRERHGSLAGYFSSLPAWLDPGRETPNARRAAELEFQQCGAHRWRDAETTLLDAGFLLAKCEAGMAVDLAADYRALLQGAPGDALGRRRALQLASGAIELSMHVVAPDPAQLASQMVGRLLALRDQPGVAALVDDLSANAPRPWFRPLHPSLDPPGGPLLRVLDHSAPVFSLAVTPDGERAVCGFSSRRRHALGVWELATGRLLRVVEGHSDYWDATVTPDGRWAVCASSDRTLRVWDLAIGQIVHTLEGHTDGVSGVAVTPDGKRAVSASYDHTLKIWDLATGQTVRTLEGHTDGVSDVVVAPDGRQAVSASWDKTLRVWDLATGLVLRTLEGHEGGVSGVAVTPDGKCAVSASCDKTLRVWDLATGDVVLTLEGHGDDVCDVAVTPDGTRAVSGSNDKTVRVWDLSAGTELLTLAGHSYHVSRVAVTPDGTRALSASLDGTVIQWDLTAPGSVPRLEAQSDRISGVAVTPDGALAVSASKDTTLMVWDPAGGRPVRALTGHFAHVYRAAVTADGTRAVSASKDKTLRLWDLATGRSLLTLEGHSGTVSGVAVTPDGTRAVSASHDGTLRVWDLATGLTLHTLEGHSAPVLAVAAMPDGARAVSASHDKTLKIWDLATGSTLRTLHGHEVQVVGLAVSPDGTRAVSSSPDETLKEWDLETGGVLRTMQTRSVKVDSVAVTPDGSFVVCASRDQTLTLWDLHTGLAVATFHCDAPVLGCACAAGNLVVAGDARGRVSFLTLEL